MRVLIAALLGLLAGFALSSALFTKSPSAIALEAANTALAVHRGEAQTSCTTDWSRLHTEIERAVHASLTTHGAAGAEVAAATAAAPQAPNAAPEPQAATELTPEQLKAREGKEQLLADATSRGEWTRADADRARSLITALSKADRRDFMSRIAMGINSRALKPEDITRPF